MTDHFIFILKTMILRTFHYCSYYFLPSLKRAWSGLFLLCAMPVFCFAQYAGAAGTPTSTAIFQDSSVFRAWATGCTVERGFLNIADPSLGRATAGDSSLALGKAGSNATVSLGDGGSAILTFKNPIANGAGADFAVFENGFADNFLELAFVEVSSNGIDFVRFPAVSNMPFATQIDAFDFANNATNLYNLAGKYRARCGTPFDLDELKNSANLNINAITHVKIIDVVGSINPQFASLDSRGNLINDPYPTPFPQGGFDLEAVGVIHEKTAQNTEKAVSFYPNPLQNNLFITINVALKSLQLFDIQGKLVENFLPQSQIYPCESLPKGVYLLVSIAENGDMLTQKLVKYP
jgi:Secretion system C-terminal sorting domain